MTWTRAFPRPIENVARFGWERRSEKTRSIRSASVERDGGRRRACDPSSKPSGVRLAQTRGVIRASTLACLTVSDAAGEDARTRTPVSRCGHAPSGEIRRAFGASRSAEYHACESARRSIPASGAARMLTSSCCVIIARSSQLPVIDRSSQRCRVANAGGLPPAQFSVARHDVAYVVLRFGVRRHAAVSFDGTGTCVVRRDGELDVAEAIE